MRDYKSVTKQERVFVMVDFDGTNCVDDVDALYEFVKSMTNIHRVLTTMKWMYRTNNDTNNTLEKNKKLLHHLIESAHGLARCFDENMSEISNVTNHDNFDSNFQTLLENLIKETKNTINLSLKFADIVHDDLSHRSHELLETFQKLRTSFLRVERLAMKL